MAKAYLTQSKRIGSVGGETYSVVKGQCIVKAKPVSVANPRTRAQVLQRARFLDAVKFFQHGTQQLFKFAFEDKRPHESDYNAFMRYNAKNGIMLTKNLASQSGAAYVGNWQLTQGSMVAPQYNWSGTDAVLTGVTSEGGCSMVGELSAWLKESYGLQDGDIVTIVNIKSNVTEITYGITSEEFRYQFLNNQVKPVNWKIYQFVVDEDNMRPLGTIGLQDIEAGDSSWVISNNPNADVAEACAVIFSRKNGNSVFVSTSNLVSNEIGREIISNNETASNRDLIYKDWASAEEAILQGAVAL